MAASMTVDEYISKNDRWEKELNHLRDIVLKTELTEEIKWGAPSYSFGGKNVLAIVAFKNFVALWFHQGVFLSDPNSVLINAQKDVTRGLRQWRFTSLKEINSKMVFDYIIEAIENQKAGKEIKPKAKKLIIPEELSNALNSNSDLKNSFEQLSPSKQKEYAEHINMAKQATTRTRRLEKCIPMILTGKGLHDKYKK